jgi:predicted solute-binding protein
VQPFYGITATVWVYDDSPQAAQAEVIIVEGAEALREPEGGFSEDLSRAWFILTAQPVVTHLLLAPRQLTAGPLAEMTSFLQAALAEASARRNEWRPRLADEADVPRERAAELWSAQRLRLEEPDRQALLDLVAKGMGGATKFSAADVQFREGAGDR